MNHIRHQHASLLDLIADSIGLPERGLIRLALSTLAFGVAFYAIRHLVG
ncbi:hypothetical protein LFL96_36735 (plasmid) [Paraburkholderia sp. D15]|nr:hypothetical protein [Paraburkholderia sp. D15]WGS55025.1 hypothetical protein LFL96_36735 [Paraburkholderia sp. D15]